MVTRFRKGKPRFAMTFAHWRGRLREHAEMLEGVLESAPDGMVVVDPAGRIRLVNRQVEEMFGYRREELYGQFIELLIPERFRAVHALQRANYFQDPRVRPLGVGLKLFGLRNDGSEFPVDISLSPLRAGKLVMAIAAIRDVTERKKSEQLQALQHIIAGVLAGSLTLTEAASKLLQTICEGLGWGMGELWEVDRTANLLRHRESWHVPALEAEELIAVSREMTFAPGEGLPGRVWQGGQPAWVVDVATDLGFVRAALAARAGLHGAFAFPIVLGTQILGVMIFFCRHLRQPDEKLLERLTLIGSQIGQFIERKRAEEELRLSEERYRTLHRDNPTMIFTLDEKLTILSANPFGAKQLGFTIDELEGQPVLDIFHEDDRPGVAEQLRNCLQNPGTVYRWLFRKIHKDGTLLWVEELAQTVYGPQGVLRVLLVCQDITERRRAEEALREQEERFRLVALATRDAIYDWDIRSGHVWRNEAYRELYSADEPTRPDHAWWAQRIHPDDRQRVLSNIAQAFHHGDSFWSDEYRFRRSDGSFASLMDRGYILYDEAGQPIRMIGAITDITREREIDRMKNEFISTAAHELRTPLTTVMGYLQLLQGEERFTPEERKEFLQLVYEKSEVLERIIRDLLDLSRVQTGKLVIIEKVRKDLRQLVRHSVATYQGISSRHVFRLEFPDEAVELCLDPGKIGQVLDNLFSNALKFSPAGGTIRVSGHYCDGEFEVTVADEGIGMGPEEVTRMFDKFYRADASHTAVGGLGLGMNIARNIVEAHGGRIWVESMPGRGTQVHFTLPLEEHCE